MRTLVHTYIYMYSMRVFHFSSSPPGPGSTVESSVRLGIGGGRIHDVTSMSSKISSDGVGVIAVTKEDGVEHREKT